MNTSLQEHINRWKSLTGPRRAAARPADVDLATTRQVLEDMLTTAIQLEFATIPPYLCALWSIKDDLHPIAKSLREIVQEEMLHMGLTCNMLASIGGQPPLRALAPTYPGPLPGDVHQGLTVELQQLRKESLETFLRIEAPVKLASSVPRELNDPGWTGARTIGAFYHCVIAAFEEYEGAGGDYQLERQVSASLVWRVIGSLKDVKRAVEIITTQGEGSTLKDGPDTSPRDSSRDDYAHYYRFLEMWKEKRLVRLGVRMETPERYEWQEGYSLPDRRPMGPVPLGGFANAEPEVRQLLSDFQRTYHEMLRLLEETWVPGGQGKLIHAIARMFELEKFAKPLMEIPRRDNATMTYGPVFAPPAKPNEGQS